MDPSACPASAARSCHLHSIHASQGIAAPVDLSGYHLIHSGDMTGNMTEDMALVDLPFVL
jgi:hypothetical protein